MRVPGLAVVATLVACGVLLFFLPFDGATGTREEALAESTDVLQQSASGSPVQLGKVSLSKAQAAHDRNTVTGSKDECPAHCSWQFVKYTSSVLEETWVAMEGTNVEHYNVCPDIKKHIPPELLKRWIGYTVDNQPISCNATGKLGTPDRSTPARTAPSHVTDDHEVFSTFEYECSCTVAGRPAARRVVPIEPLAGPLRYPTTCFEYGAPSRKDYMIVDEWGASVARDRVRVGADAGPTKSFLFDAGASTFGDGLGGASQSWFFETYRRRCVDFDMYAGWEPTPLNHQQFWEAIPEGIRPIYHYYNTFCSSDLEDTMNPLNMINAQATVEDFVAFKLDIDTPSVELPIVQQILDNPHIAAKIDEFFFEHHVLFQPMEKDWVVSKCKGTYKESIDTFLKLRQMGVRAHSWV